MEPLPARGQDRDIADSRTMPDSRAPKRRIRSQSSARASGEILKLVAEGNSSKEIATLLGIAPASVDTYRSRLMFKLNVEDVPDSLARSIRKIVGR